jgi:hypothetical protein
MTAVDFLPVNCLALSWARLDGGCCSLSGLAWQAWCKKDTADVESAAAYVVIELDFVQVGATPARRMSWLFVDFVELVKAQHTHTPTVVASRKNMGCPDLRKGAISFQVRHLQSLAMIDLGRACDLRC